MAKICGQCRFENCLCEPERTGNNIEDRLYRIENKIDDFSDEARRDLLEQILKEMKRIERLSEEIKSIVDHHRPGGWGTG